MEECCVKGKLLQLALCFMLRMLGCILLESVAFSTSVSLNSMLFFVNSIIFVILLVFSVNKFFIVLQKVQKVLLLIKSVVSRFSFLKSLLQWFLFLYASRVSEFLILWQELSSCVVFIIAFRMTYVTYGLWFVLRILVFSGAWLVKN